MELDGFDPRGGIVLLASTLPPGARDENPILRVLHDAPPELAHPTLVRFEDLVEVIGWQWHEPVVRGRETTLEVALRVLKPLPAGSKLYLRLQQGRLSRVNPAPHELAEGLYPPQHWRAGDYILPRFTVTVPMLEVLPGAHEVMLGMRRTESSNLKISFPATDDPARRCRTGPLPAHHGGVGRRVSATRRREGHLVGGGFCRFESSS